MVVADGVTTVERIPAGHKVAIKPIAVGEPVRRYGQIIGFATIPIAPGQHVHTQNCGMGDFAKDYAFGVDVTPTPNFDLPATFEGIRRSDGRVATRNYIGILTSVNCSAHVAGMVADIFKKNPFTGDNPLADFPNVDGVVALTHKTGCGMTQDEPLALLRRTLGGYARHANFSAVVVLGLGCEVNQIGGLMQEQKLAGRLRAMDIQEVGGTRKTVEAGVAFVREALTDANKVKREPVPASELTTNLVGNDANGATSDVFLRDVAAGQTIVVSTNAAGVQSDKSSTSPSISAEGRWVSFDTKATNFNTNDSGGDLDVYVKDLETGAIDQASVRSGGGQASGTNGSTAVGADSTISADGRFVAFWSDAATLVDGDTNGDACAADKRPCSDVFVRDRVANTTTRMTSTNGVQGDEESFSPALSMDGRFVAFDSRAASLDPTGGSASSQDIFVHVNF